MGKLGYAEGGITVKKLKSFKKNFPMEFNCEQVFMDLVLKLFENIPFGKQGA